jgi:hypothetical protein
VGESLNSWVGLGDWPSGGVLLALGLLSFAIGGGALAYILVKRGRTRAATPDEVTNQLMRRTAAEQVSYAASSGSGVRREVSFGIDDLRLIAKRGEWTLFWACPISFVGFGLGFQFIFMAASVWAHTAGFALAASFVCFVFCFSGPFMAWAALYTDIDAGTADPPP